MRATEAITYWNHHKRTRDDLDRMTHYTPGLNRYDDEKARKKAGKRGK